MHRYSVSWTAHFCLLLHVLLQPAAVSCTRWFVRAHKRSEKESRNVTTLPIALRMSRTDAACVMPPVASSVSLQARLVRPLIRAVACGSGRVSPYTSPLELVTRLYRRTPIKHGRVGAPKAWTTPVCCCLVFAKWGVQPGDCERKTAEEEGNDETLQMVGKQEK